MYDWFWHEWWKNSWIPDKYIKDIFEDNTWNIWIATKKWVWKYTGVSWINYGKGTLPSKKANVVYQSTYNDAMMFGTDKWVAILSWGNWSSFWKWDGIQGKKVKSISEDSSTNNIYFATDKWVSVLDYKKYVDTWVKDWNHYWKSDDWKPWRKVYTLYENNNFKIWWSDHRSRWERGKKW